MSHTLLFLPDISGFTKFVQTTEVEHSQHVISELLELLIDANKIGMELAEIEGDALFFYKEGNVPTKEALLSQMEAMFTAFYSHLALMDERRICPCNACSSAPDLELKIVAHCGPLSFIKVHNSRKPFGQQVIEAHRLLKNSVPLDSYALMSSDLANGISVEQGKVDEIFDFNLGSDIYDDQEVTYLFSPVSKEHLQISVAALDSEIDIQGEPQLYIEDEFDMPKEDLFEIICNFAFRHEWMDGVKSIGYIENEVNRLGTEHVCFVDSSELDFVTITKDGEPGQLIYGEHTKSPPPIDDFIQFFIVEDLPDGRSKLGLQMYWNAKSIVKRSFMKLIGRRFFGRAARKSVAGLQRFVAKYQIEQQV